MNYKLLLRRIGFYLLSFTWGGLTSIIGLLIIAALAPFKKVHCYHGRLYAEVGKNWGGLELGCFFICSSNSSEQLKAHECGHGIQNIIFGPLMPFIVMIPSAIRYWYRELAYYRRGRTPKTKYNDMWFEGWATYLGLRYIATDVL